MKSINSLSMDEAFSATVSADRGKYLKRPRRNSHLSSLRRKNLRAAIDGGVESRKRGFEKQEEYHWKLDPEPDRKRNPADPSRC